MMDSSYRPMPQSVLRAYRADLKLDDLLASQVFMLNQRVQVRDELLRRLLAKYGSADIPYMTDDLSTSDIPRFFGDRDFECLGIDVLIQIDEYGGPEGVSRELAEVMQPYWFAWWSEFRWASAGDFASWRKVAKIVLGKPQRRWIAAQYARHVVDKVIGYPKKICLLAIESAEDYAEDQSVDGEKKMRALSNSLDQLADESDEESSWAIRAASGACTENAAAAMMLAGEGASIAGASYDDLVAITKKLITPTLVTSPSGGAR